MSFSELFLVKCHEDFSRTPNTIPSRSLCSGIGMYWISVYAWGRLAGVMALVSGCSAEGPPWRLPEPKEHIATNAPASAAFSMSVPARDPGGTDRRGLDTRPWFWVAMLAKKKCKIRGTIKPKEVLARTWFRTRHSFPVSQTLSLKSTLASMQFIDSMNCSKRLRRRWEGMSWAVALPFWFLPIFAILMPTKSCRSTDVHTRTMKFAERNLKHIQPFYSNLVQEQRRAPDLDQKGEHVEVYFRPGTKLWKLTFLQKWTCGSSFSSKSEHVQVHFQTKVNIHMLLLSSFSRWSRGFCEHSVGTSVRQKNRFWKSPQNGGFCESFFCRGDCVSQFLPRGTILPLLAHWVMTMTTMIVIIIIIIIGNVERLVECGHRQWHEVNQS